MAGSKRDFIEVGDPSLCTDKMDQWIKDGVDLVSLIAQGDIKDVENVKQYLECSGGSADIDKTNNEGQTPLMIACRNGQTAIINFLLEAGAKPNLMCTKLGNSALHYACQGTGDVVSMCREEPNYPKEKLQEIIKIIQILANHGAVPGLNADGLSPICVAALNSFRDVVEFFASSDAITTSNTDKVKAYELLGVSQAVFDKHHLNHACTAFHLAYSYSKDTDDTLRHVNSDLGTWFHAMMNKKKLSKIEQFQVKSKAVLIGLQCLPDKIKDEHKFTDIMAKCAEDALSNGRALEEGYGLFAALIKKEIQAEYPFNSVLESMQSPAEESPASSEILQLIPKVLEIYAEAFKGGNCRPSRRESETMLELLGVLLCNLAAYQAKSKCLDESLLHVGCLVNTLKNIYNGETSQNEDDQGNLSILTSFFERMADIMLEEVYCGQSKKRLNRLAFAIHRMLYFNGFHADLDKSVLQTFLEIIPSARDMEFILSVCRVLIRFGCPTDDAYLEDANEEEDGVAELLELLSPPTTPISLEELASRKVLSNVIPYKDRLPMVIYEKLERDLLKYDPSELDSSSDSDSD